jgi:hypothetical protein
MGNADSPALGEDHAAIEASENALAGQGSEWWTAVNYS